MSDKKKKTIDMVVKVFLIVIIILLLIHNCTLIKKVEDDKSASGNVDIIEIECDDDDCKTEEIKSLTFAQEKVYVRKGASVNLIVIVEPSNLSSSELTWKSSNPSVATVDSNGVVKAISEGTTTITVRSSNGKETTCVVEVVGNTVILKKIELVPNDNSIVVGVSTHIKAVFEPTNATNTDLVWTSSNEDIATVDNKGVVEGISPGTVTIIAKTKDGTVMASTTITVNEFSGSMDVFDHDNDSDEWDGSTNLNIFYNSMYKYEDKIAPEISNTYQFVVKNGTNCNQKYNIVFNETNPYNINMQYKLKKNDTYLIDNYVRANELNVSNIILKAGKNDTFYLEWKWFSSDNDTEIGMNSDANYKFEIEVKAECVNG